MAESPLQDPDEPVSGHEIVFVDHDVVLVSTLQAGHGSVDRIELLEIVNDGSQHLHETSGVRLDVFRKQGSQMGICIEQSLVHIEFVGGGQKSLEAFLDSNDGI